MEQSKTRSTSQTISKTLFTARIIDGFWDRWRAHGVQAKDLAKTRSTFTTLEQWMCSWTTLAHEKVVQAKEIYENGFPLEAEILLRIAGLYYQLAQWLLIERTEEKVDWFTMSIDVVRLADELSSIETRYETIEVNGVACYGRIRIPNHPKGVVVIINPFDSAKEELFTYEMDYLGQGYITMCFDGPGQGETYVKHGFKATTSRWKEFINQLIQYAHTCFSQYKIYLFGTSSGAAWALYGSISPYVTKAVAVSPAFMNKDITLPDYFVERVGNLTESENAILPDFEQLTYRNPVLLAHGKKDVMVSNQDIYALFEQLPNGKKLLEYEEEGHCCNYKLREIRQISVGWFQKGEDNDEDRGV